MAISLPSPKTVIADIPEVKEFRSDFVYNFFKPDERINDSGRTDVKFLETRPAESFDSEFVVSDKFNRFAPRYVKFEWSPSTEQEIFTNVKIRDNLSKVHIENDFVADFYSSYRLQDDGVDRKMNFFVKKLALQARDQEKVNSHEDGFSESYLDVAKSINSRTSDEISPNLVCESIVNDQSEGHVYLDGDGLPIKNQGMLTELNNVSFDFQINKKFARQTFETIKDNSFSFFEDESEDLIQEAKVQEANSMGAKNPNLLDGQDYDFEIQEFVDYRTLDTNGYNPRKQTLGYIIDKTEITSTGDFVVHEPIILESPNINSAIDLKVKYGGVYVYNIRAVTWIESQAEDIETGEIVILSYLISSKPSAAVRIECKEAKPPPAPVDFDARWNHKKRIPILEWCFPVNPQRDIKQWQIFRRKTIDEPFELIKVYDFDDSVVKNKDAGSETIDPILVETLSSPINYYPEKEFKLDSKYIYTVCSVDARGLSSNYSRQIEITFNRFKNQINKKLISLSGAPKAYPNFFLQADTFVDSIRDSGHKKLSVYFSPEYLKVSDKENNDLGLLKTGAGSSYQLSLINVDLQTQKNVTFTLNDRRTSLSKNLAISKNRLVQNNKKKFGRTRRRTSRA